MAFGSLPLPHCIFLRRVALPQQLWCQTTDRRRRRAEGGAVLASGRRQRRASHEADDGRRWRTVYAYKGEATYFDVEADGRVFAYAARSYETPLEDAAKIPGEVCFLGEGIEIEVN